MKQILSVIILVFVLIFFALEQKQSENTPLSAPSKSTNTLFKNELSIQNITDNKKSINVGNINKYEKKHTGKKLDNKIYTDLTTKIEFENEIQENIREQINHEKIRLTQKKY